MSTHAPRRLTGPREGLDALRPLSIWHFLRRQPLSYWLISFFLFLEYVRPQSIYTSLAVLPWSQLTLIACCVALVLEGRRWKLPTILSPMYIAFLGIVLASSLFAWNPSLSWANIQLPLSWFVIFLLVVNIVNTRDRFLIFMLGFLLYSLKMSQHGTRSWIGIGLGFRDWGATGAPGWFHNSGEFGIQMCVFLPLSVAFLLALRRNWESWKKWIFWAMPVTAIISMIASSSRGALVGGLAVVFWMILQTRHRFRGTIAAVAVVIVTWLVIPEAQKERLATMGEDDTSTYRLEMWEDGIEMANENPVLGIGFNNWHQYYGRSLPHNIFIEAWAELGYTGFFVFLAMIAGTFHLNRGTRRAARRLPDGRFIYYMAYGLDGALVGLLASGFFVTVLHYPFFWINLAMTVSLRLAAADELKRLRRAQVRRIQPRPSVGTLSRV